VGIAHAIREKKEELEEWLRQAAAKTQAWCELARSNEAAASGLRATPMPYSSALARA
jgi:E3 ubiquitin-protein ligase BOI-like protein